MKISLCYEFAWFSVRQTLKMNWKIGNNDQTYPILIDWLIDVW